MLELLRDMYPDLCRFNVAVYPSADYEDVITGPYNAVLATKWLTEASDCVIPLENSALLDYRARQAGLAHRNFLMKTSTLASTGLMMLSHSCFLI